MLMLGLFAAWFVVLGAFWGFTVTRDRRHRYRHYEYHGGIKSQPPHFRKAPR